MVFLFTKKKMQYLSVSSFESAQYTLTAKRKVHSRWSLLSSPLCPFCNCLSLSTLLQASKLSQPPLIPGSSTESNDSSLIPPLDLLPSLLQNEIDSDSLISYHSKPHKQKDAISTLKVFAYGCCCCSVVKLCLTLCNPMDCSTPGFPVLHYFPEFAQVMFIELVMLSNHPILCSPLLLLLSIW